MINIAQFRMAYLKKVQARHARRIAKDESIQFGRSNMHHWELLKVRTDDMIQADADFQQLSDEFGELVAGDTELVAILAKFYSDREKANKAALEAVRGKDNVIIPGDKQ